jgi:HEPN domain-containing protein
VDVATERGSDAAALLAARRQLGALYFQGYVVEAYAKALCCAKGVKPGKTHDIIALIELAGFTRQDLPPDLREYAETRSVEMRYLIKLEPGLDFQSQVERGRRLAGWLRTRVNRLL